MGKRQDQPEAEAQDKPADGQLVIVGIGASAGGLEALQELLSHLPEASNVAYVIAQHISPTHKSMMAAILQKNTDKRVLEPENGRAIEPNAIYITPPNTNIFIDEGCFELKEPGTEVILPKPSIDLFFTSLARAMGEKAVGVILSGTGTDGRLGMRAIKNAGGITLAQEPKTAKYDSMPLASIDQQLVDIVSTTREMGEELSDIFDWLAGKLESRPSQAPQSDLMIILGLVKQYHGVDFSQYKTNTIYRRIKRRVVATGTKDTGQYIRHLQDNPDEVRNLYKDLLIGVTHFFRDPRAFEQLRQALEESYADKTDLPDPFRAWVVGCSTGEEAYSLAILLCEIFDEDATMFSVFATDIDAESIQVARSGVYEESLVKDVPSELRKKYFNRRGDKYQVNKRIRDVLLFSIHDVTRDPPFSKIDLISCRNLLIYFNSDLQRRVLRSLTFGLKVGGHLFLGVSESLAEYQDAYSPVSREDKVFRKILTPDFKTQFYAGAGLVPRPQQYAMGDAIPDKKTPEVALHDALLSAIGNQFLPLSVIVNESLTVIYSRKKNPYLSLPAGASNLLITKMVPSELELDIRTTIHSAIKNGSIQHSRYTRVERADGRECLVRIAAMPLGQKGQDARLAVVSFLEESPEALGVVFEGAPVEKMAVAERKQLEFELEQSKAQLQSVIEELETTNEELQSTNEELQSTNEELQSTNEELETANEELQSTNEEVQVAYNELQIVSEEHLAQRNIAEETSRKLEHQRVLFEGVSESSIDGIMVFAAVRDEETSEIVDFRWKYANRAACDIVGRSSEELIGRRLLVEMPGNREEDLFDIYREVVNRRESVEREFFYPHEKLKHWFKQVVVPLGDGFVVTFSDITAEKAREELLELNETRLRLATQVAGIGIWSLDFGSGELACNDIMFSQLDSTEETLNTLQQWLSLLPASSANLLSKELRSARKTGHDLEIDYEVDLLGETQYFKVIGRVVRSSGGKVLRIVGTHINENDTHMLRSGISDFRSRALAAGTVKDRIMANISHEMRTPIHGILGLAQLLEATELDEEQAGLVGNISRASVNLSRIINDVLDYSKLEADQLVLEDVEFLLSDVLRDAMDPVVHAARAKNLALDWDVQEDLPPVLFGDNFRLCQVLVNLLSNAVKFTGNGGKVHLNVSIESASPGLVLRFTVSDTGIGISEEVIKDLFMPFAQAEHSTTRRFGGTGLGLSISKSIVELMGGSIWVESTPGKGSKFHFTACFRAGKTKALRFGQKIKAAETHDDPVPRLAGKRVLLVEDEPVNATVAIHLLRMVSVDVDHVENGQQAIEALDGARRYDAVLMDCQMPVMDGFSATRQLRKWNKFRNLPVIALTANAFAEDRERAIESGMNDFLAKPFAKEDLYEMLAGWISPARSSDTGLARSDN